MPTMTRPSNAANESTEPNARPVTAGISRGWQLNDDHAARRAPAHDETGHTWQHSDEAIFEKVKYGRFDAARTDLVSYMPAFRDSLNDADILAVMAFIKRRWPLGLRVSQAMLNPNYAGMPPDADRVEWRLPPTCMGGVRRASSP